MTGWVQIPGDGGLLVAAVSAADEDLEESEDEIETDADGVQRKDEAQITAFAAAGGRRALLRSRGLTLRTGVGTHAGRES